MSSFTWDAPNGDKITLPSLNSVTAGTVRKYRKLGDVDFMFSLLEDVMDEGELTKLDALGLADAERMFTEWQKSEGTSVPQS